MIVQILILITCIVIVAYVLLYPSNNSDSSSVLSSSAQGKALSKIGIGFKAMMVIFVIYFVLIIVSHRLNRSDSSGDLKKYQTKITTPSNKDSGLRIPE
jgi:preprotein translocase subunit SecG